MAFRPPHYFAFVKRGLERRYQAALHDLPDCHASADSIELLVEALRRSARMRFEPHSFAWPVPTEASELPRRMDDHEGFWLQVDLGEHTEAQVRQRRRR